MPQKNKIYFPPFFNSTLGLSALIGEKILRDQSEWLKLDWRIAGSAPAGC